MKEKEFSEDGIIREIGHLLQKCSFLKSPASYALFGSSMLKFFIKGKLIGNMSSEVFFPDKGEFSEADSALCQAPLPVWSWSDGGLAGPGKDRAPPASAPPCPGDGAPSRRSGSEGS